MIMVTMMMLVMMMTTMTSNLYTSFSTFTSIWEPFVCQGAKQHWMPWSPRHTSFERERKHGGHKLKEDHRLMDPLWKGLRLKGTRFESQNHQAPNQQLTIIRYYTPKKIRGIEIRHPNMSKMSTKNFGKSDVVPFVFSYRRIDIYGQMMTIFFNLSKRSSCL